MNCFKYHRTKGGGSSSGGTSYNYYYSQPQGDSNGNANSDGLLSVGSSSINMNAMKTLDRLQQVNNKNNCKYNVLNSNKSMRFFIWDWKRFQKVAVLVLQLRRWVLQAAVTPLRANPTDFPYYTPAVQTSLL